MCNCPHNAHPLIGTFAGWGLNKAASYDSPIRLWGGGILVDINIQIGKNPTCCLTWENVAYHQVRSSVLGWQLVPDMYESSFGLVAI